MTDESDGRTSTPVGRVSRMFHAVRLWLGRALA
jgi:hypothetical protein